MSLNWGVRWYWVENRQGLPRVHRRTARTKLQGAVRRIKDWVQRHRHLPGRTFMKGLNRRLVGHYNYYSLRGSSCGLWCFYQEAIASAFKWLSRRGGKCRSFTSVGFTQALRKLGVAKHRFTEQPRWSWRMFA